MILQTFMFKSIMHLKIANIIVTFGELQIVSETSIKLYLERFVMMKSFHSIVTVHAFIIIKIQKYINAL